MEGKPDPQEAQGGEDMETNAFGSLSIWREKLETDLNDLDTTAGRPDNKLRLLLEQGKGKGCSNRGVACCPRPASVPSALSYPVLQKWSRRCSAACRTLCLSCARAWSGACSTRALQVSLLLLPYLPSDSKFKAFALIRHTGRQRQQMYNHASKELVDCKQLCLELAREAGVLQDYCAAIKV